MLKGEKGRDFETGYSNEKFGPRLLTQRLRHLLQSRWCRLGLLLALGIPLLVFLVLLIVVLVRAGSVGSPASSFELLNSVRTDGVSDGKHLERALRLAGALKIPTVSGDTGVPAAALLQLHEYIKTSFPSIHGSGFVRREVVANFSLLYTVQGSRPGKLPFLLASHLDVVPASNTGWEAPPFGGEIVNNTFIYGRGALDDKGGVFGILEALEYMINRGEQPLRTFYLAFGHDEEVGGFAGAQEVAKALRSRGVSQLDFILDEGFTITRGLLPGPTIPVALIGVSEKGIANIELSVNGTPGHSSMPPWETPIGILSTALSKLEENKLPSMLGTGAEQSTFEYIAPYTEFGYRMLYGNIWLFHGPITSALEKSQITNAIVRTTTALTIFKSGTKENVVPPLATANVNHRIHPSQSVADVVAHDKRVIDDPRVQFKVTRSREASPTSPFGPTDLNYQLIARSITQTFDNVVVAPGVMVANTDMQWFLDFSKQIYRFFPAVLEFADTTRLHGFNERISIENYQNAVSFYYRVLKNADLVYNLIPNDSNIYVT